MEFDTDTEAYNFYNSYALQVGFGVRKTSSSYSRKQNEEDPTLIAKTFICDKEGKKEYNRKDGSTCRRESRVGCGARMRIVHTPGNTWKVSRFVEAHIGHELTSPNKAMKHRSHMVLHRSEHVRGLMDKLRDEGLPPSAISKVLHVGSASADVSITPQQCQDHLCKSRNNNIGKQCSEIIDMFANKKLLDPDFYFAWEVDQYKTMRSIFWGDGRSRSSYLKFGDVVVFNVTYKTNKMCLPFAPFTGVNHRRQSILFGCALLADEEEDTFVWLFTEWLKRMYGQPPTSIITDQDIAIGNAIRRMFPMVRHRFCSWHIGKHVIEHLPKLQSTYEEDIGTYFNRWRYSSNVMQAELNWKELKERFRIDEFANTWLPTMCRKRHHWVHAYLTDTFWAGMRSTQRSESINSFFDSYVNAQTQLHEFVSCYDKALEHCRATKLHEDFMSLNTKPSTDNCHAFEVQAGMLYTRCIFKMFQEEMKGRDRLFRCEEGRNSSSITYSIGSVNEDRSKRCVVTYKDQNPASAKCSCALFKTTGLLCRHILNVMCNLHQLQTIPEQYILDRWRIDARHRSIRDLMHGRRSTSTSNCTLEAWAARVEFNEIVQLTSSSVEVLQELRAMLSSFAARHELTSNKGQKLSQVESNTTVHDLSANITIRDPSGPAVTKGRPRGATRLKSSLEEGLANRNKKQRTCQNCFQKGHYRTSCKNPPAPSSANAQDSHEQIKDFDNDSSS